jgi:DNA-binding transcriptional LysR family regulator
MDFNDIPVFLRVVDAGSFTEAARALGREKSSVSRSVARLEEDLGVRLLQRTTRKLSLTDAGQAFFERVRGALSGVEEAASVIRELGSTPRGLVRMTAAADGDALGIPDALAAFHVKYPEVHVEISLTSRAVDLVAEGFDLAIRGGKLVDSSLVTRRIGTADIAVFAAPSYLKRKRTPESLSDLAEHECVLFRARNGSSSWTLTGPDGDETVNVTGPITVDNMTFAAHVCAAGMGIALLPIPLAGPLVDAGKIELLLPEYRFGTGSLSVVLPSSSFVPSRVALLRDFLVEHLGKTLAATQAVCKEKEKQRVSGRQKAKRKAS